MSSAKDGSSNSGYQTFGLKIGFPPGFPMRYKTIKLSDYNISVRDTINFICAKNAITRADQYIMQIIYMGGDSFATSTSQPNPNAPPVPSRQSVFIPNPAAARSQLEKRTRWMDDNVKLSSYPLNAPEVVLEMRKKQQVVKIVCHSESKALVSDVTKPISNLLGFAACKFNLGDDADYRLFHNNHELTDGDIRSLNIDLSLPFFLKDKSDSRSFETPDDPSQYTEEHEISDDESTSNVSLDVPAKSVVALKEGYLKIQNRKKSWNSRYFILTDKFLYFYKSPHDKRASGVINFKDHVIRVMGSPREGKLELIHKDPHHTGQHIYLKFDSETEMQAWNIAPFTFQCHVAPSPAPVKGKPIKGIFGVPLERTIPPGAEVPMIVTQAIDYIEKRAMDVVGIFRLSGSVNTIENWKKMYDKGDKCDLMLENDPHAVAGLLKLYLRELPEPVLTYDKYEKFIAAQSMDDLASRIKLIKHLVRSLPAANLAVLTKLISFLGRVAQHSANNKMQLHNLSTVFGPNLIREKQSKSESTNVQNLVEDTPIINALTLSLIRDYPYIFGDKELPEQKIMAKTLYEYNGGTAEDLDFPQGVKIRVTSQARDGWWAGEYEGKTGRFPATYVEIIPQVQSSASSSSLLLRTKSNPNISKKKKFMIEMENSKTKVADNEKLLQQLLERKEKLHNSIAALKQEQQQLANHKDTVKLTQLISTLKQKPAIANIPKTIDTLLIKYNEYKKSHDDLATINKVLVEETDLFNNNPKVKAKLESKEKEAIQARVDTIASKLEDASKSRQKSLSSKRIINDDLEEIKISITIPAQ
ncbi:hypothetical protein SAMD00019534_045650 [Acytostelium subglobosum LB1]|uniref:hypothetical protein n=1 Tax=Acytostelium subglobosum LB1 TaxID=1410327 RepID=UPI0006448AEC|nr:hypothetical protein SAMD00019534_045650 [Acytostelium subglobosum LB1]GAM21390.1 hypothetical protein SAMD00019534_045650 [Acytostelium subglobosum LB1]|eukprot:XP_012755509.1 hypothetical protein SAMD00019534_045650 [Acytostelium subglobosum LB1]